MVLPTHVVQLSPGYRHVCEVLCEWVLMMYLSIYHIVRTSFVFNFTELCLLMTNFGPGPVIDHQKRGHVTFENDVFTSDILCRYNYYLPRHLTYWGRDKMANIFQTNFSNAFFLIIFFLILNISLFLRVQLMIIQHWFRWWLGAEQATRHYLNQWCPGLLTHFCLTWPQWVKTWSAFLCASFRTTLFYAIILLSKVKSLYRHP